MTYQEFCAEIAPSVLELEDECRGMTADEFEQIRKSVIEHEKKSESSRKFITAIMDYIYNRIFLGGGSNKQNRIKIIRASFIRGASFLYKF